jgi:fucose permease
MGIYAFVFMGFFPLGSLQAGLLAHWVSAPFAVIFGAVVCVVAAVVVARLVPPVSK